MKLMSKAVVVSKVFDGHVHFRVLPTLYKVVGSLVKFCYAAVAMGNTDPPYSENNVAFHKQTIKEIAAQKGNSKFTPVMTIMLTVDLTKESVKKAYDKGAQIIKLIPGNASTNSRGMVALENLWQYYGLLDFAFGLGMKFSLHCELAVDPKTGQPICRRDREDRAILFLDQLVQHAKYFCYRPTIIVEHISTKALLDYILEAPDWVYGTITTHHLFGTHDMVCHKDGRVKRPGYYCMPILKTWRDVYALRAAIFSETKKLFFGSDFAPHPPEKKDLNLLKGKTPNIGIVCPPEVSVPLIWEIFNKNFSETRVARKHFNAFMSDNAAQVYGLEPNSETIRMVKEQWTAPSAWHKLPIFWADQNLEWKVEDEELETK